MKNYRCTLTKGGRKQASIHMDEDRLSLSGLSKADEKRILNMAVGTTYTDADGDLWHRIK